MSADDFELASVAVELRLGDVAITLAHETGLLRRMHDGRLAANVVVDLLESAVANARRTLLLYGADGVAQAKGVSIERPE